MLFLGRGSGILGNGGGCEYSISSSWQQSVLMIKVLGRNGNCLCSIGIVGDSHYW